MTSDAALAQLPNSPWLTMWLSPRTTVSRLIAMEVRPSWIPVVALAGVQQALLWVFQNYTYAVQQPGTAAGFAVFFGVVGLVYSVLISPFLIAIIGGWFGGDGDADDVRQAIAWSLVPLAVTLVAWIPLFAAFGWKAFNPDPSSDTGLQLLAGCFFLALGIAPIWAFVLQIAGVAVALHFSICRALACLLILALPAALLTPYGPW
jgi:hypothetical protein